MIHQRQVCRLALGMLLGFALSGCMTFRSPVVPYTGIGFNSTTFPVDITFDRTDVGSAVGKSSAYSILFGLIAFGDCSVQAAARNGNIAKVEHIDAKLLNILTLYVEYQTIVSGRKVEDLRQSDVISTTSESRSSATTSSQPEREGSGVAEKLSELKNLKDEGLLTEEEYEAKRKRILEGL